MDWVVIYLHVLCVSRETVFRQLRLLCLVVRWLHPPCTTSHVGRQSVGRRKRMKATLLVLLETVRILLAVQENLCTDSVLEPLVEHAMAHFLRLPESCKLRQRADIRR